MKKFLARREFLIPVGTLISGLLIFTVVSVMVIHPGPQRAGHTIKDALNLSQYLARSSSSSSLLASQPLVTPANSPNYGLSFHASSCKSPTLDLKILVLAGDGTEVDLPAIEQDLNYLGTPYGVYLSAKSPGGLTESLLDDGSCHAYYNGIILTNGDLTYYNGSAWVSGLSTDEWNTLFTFEAKFGIRAISWYTYPSADFGFQNDATAVPANTSPYTDTGTFTSAGQSIFQYLNTSTPFTIQNAYTYLAQPATDSSTTPLISDANGNALAAVHTYSDGRQLLALTFDSNPALIHSIILSYGLINWVTKGLFVGQEGVYLQSQVDDMFIDDNTWPVGTACGTPVDNTPTVYRITGSDFDQVVSWQNTLQKNALFKGVRLNMVFNGYGTEPGAYDDTTLVKQAMRYQGKFIWTNHTYDHADMDNVDASFVDSELLQNDATAQTLGLSDFTTSAMVTPDISGLRDATFLNEAYVDGIRYLVSDTSQPGENNPFPNEGIQDWVNPQILLIPRHPTNLFFNVSTPDEWVAEYNCLYASYWGQNLNYQQILDVESQTLLLDMITGNIDPEMYHQPNLRAYDGTHTLLGDLLTETLNKYAALFNVPVKSLRLDTIGLDMTNKAQLDQLIASGGLTASVTGKTITITARTAATIPVTGSIKSGNGYTIEKSQWFGDAKVAYAALSAGQSITISLR